MEEEIKYDIVIIGGPLLKYSPFAFGNAFTNIQYLLTDNIIKSQKNLDEYFKIYGFITDREGNSYKFSHITTLTMGNQNIYHLNFKTITRKDEQK